jgi:uncharacterized membrane protein
MRLPILPSLLLSLLLLILLPAVFGQIMLGGLGKLHITPQAAGALMVAIVVGGFVNIPVKRIVRHDDVVVHPLAAFGLAGYWPRLRRISHESVIAVNVGGCLIPRSSHSMNWDDLRPSGATPLPPQ